MFHTPLLLYPLSISCTYGHMRAAELQQVYRAILTIMIAKLKHKCSPVYNRRLVYASGIW